MKNRRAMFVYELGRQIAHVVRVHPVKADRSW
jgi:hypothetical protein